MKTFGLFIGKAMLLLAVVAILVLLGSTWRVSNEELGEKLLGFSAISYGGAALASAGIIGQEDIPRYPKIVLISNEFQPSESTAQGAGR